MNLSMQHCDMFLTAPSQQWAEKLPVRMVEMCPFLEQNIA